MSRFYRIVMGQRNRGRGGFTAPAYDQNSTDLPYQSSESIGLLKEKNGIQWGSVKLDLLGSQTERATCARHIEVAVLLAQQLDWSGQSTAPTAIPQVGCPPPSSWSLKQPDAGFKDANPPAHAFPPKVFVYLSCTALVPIQPPLLMTNTDSIKLLYSVLAVVLETLDCWKPTMVPLGEQESS